MRIRVIQNLFILLLLFGIGCSNSESVDIGGSLDKRELQEKVSASFHGIDELKESVYMLYLSLLEDEWEATYAFRSSNFQSSIERDVYVASLESDAKDWALLDIEFVLVETFSSESGSVDKCRVVTRTTEAPGVRTRYSVVWWELEDGEWKCDAIGAGASALMRSIDTPRR